MTERSASVSETGRRSWRGSGQLRPRRPPPPGRLELRLRLVEGRRLAVTSELGRHAEQAVERPEPAHMLRPAPLLIDPADRPYQISTGRSICRRWGSHENVTARALPRTVNPPSVAAWVVASKFAAGILLCNDSGDIS